MIIITMTQRIIPQRVAVLVSWDVVLSSDVAMCDSYDGRKYVNVSSERT
jgi:hypothetical protein